MKASILYLAFTAAVTAVSPAALAQQANALSETDQKALEDTKAFLRDQKQVDAFAAKNKDAARANENAKALMGNNPTDMADVYKLSADIFGDMATSTGGDSAAMQKLLQEAMKDPAAFANKLSPEQRAKINELAGKVEARKPSAAPR